MLIVFQMQIPPNRAIQVQLRFTKVDRSATIQMHLGIQDMS